VPWRGYPAPNGYPAPPGPGYLDTEGDIVISLRYRSLAFLLPIGERS
jgi:hypothetical protein